jgi:hypothetical protein
MESTISETISSMETQNCNRICFLLLRKKNKILKNQQFLLDSSNIDQFSITIIGFIIGGVLLMILIVSGIVFVLVRRRGSRTIVDHQNNLNNNNINLQSKSG